MTVKKILARIAKICNDNKKIYSKENYNPKWSSGSLISGARKEADGAIDSYNEILNEIRKIRLEIKNKRKNNNEL